MPRPAVPVDQMHDMQDGSDNDKLDPVRRKLPIRIHKWAVLYDWERGEFGELPPHQPGRDHRTRLHTEEKPPWVHPYKMDPNQLDELRQQLEKLHFSKTDLVSVPYQILIHHEDMGTNAFNKQIGAFEWGIMPFALCNAPSTFQRVINDVLRDHLGIFVWVYIEDILIFSKNVEEHKPPPSSYVWRRALICPDPNGVLPLSTPSMGHLAASTLIRGWPSSSR